MTKQQIIDLEKCEEMSNRGEDKDCSSCSCNGCIAQQPSDPTINELIKVIARNLVAWDTSKDNTHGLLPEVYLTNKYYYKKLTGEDYNFFEVMKKFNI